MLLHPVKPENVCCLVLKLIHGSLPVAVSEESAGCSCQSPERIDVSVVCENLNDLAARDEVKQLMRALNIIMVNTCFMSFFKVYFSIFLPVFLYKYIRRKSQVYQKFVIQQES
jgi:hypothetical protein